jgi:hypothetical protein
MITGAIKSQIDQIWNAFWSGGISNPLEVIEQITYLLFLRRLDDLHTLEENKSARLKQPMARRAFPAGKDGKGRLNEDLRWSRFKHLAPAEMHTVVGEHVFPFLRTLGGDDSTYAPHMKDARFTIPTPALLAKVAAFENWEGVFEASKDGTRLVIYKFVSDTLEVLDGRDAKRLGWVSPTSATSSTIPTNRRTR